MPGRRTPPIPDKVAAMGEKRIDERSGLVPGRRVDDESRPLVEYEEMVVLEDDVEGKTLRHGLGRHGGRQDQVDRFAGADLRLGVG
jgi:hypothetical protein